MGDWVVAQYHNADTFAVIHAVLRRKSLLTRKTAGKKIEHQAIAANIDVAFIMQSCDTDFNLRRLERYLAMIHEGHIQPHVLLSKCDLISADDMAHKLARFRRDYPCLEVTALSTVSGFGLDQLRKKMQPGNTYCLLGSSGVGKTTLLNYLLGGDFFATAAVREKDGRGRHATSRRQLILLENGAMIIDTPGMRELGLLGTDDGIRQSFTDIEELAHQCRFRNCGHQTEKGCAVLKAIEEGKLEQERLTSYLKLKKESEYHQMSYVDKRLKDKKLGHYYRSVLKGKEKLYRK